MINNPGVIASEPVSVQGRSFIFERKSGVISDNLLDAAARQYAVNIRLGQKLEERPPLASYSLARDLVRIR
jgi:hypothetical protein